MSNETPKKRGQYEKHDSARCAWCGDVFETNHGNANTCGQRCRSNLKRYRDYTGMEPDGPQGRNTAQTAILQLVNRLLAAERRRRQNELMLASVPFGKRDRMADELHAAEEERRRRDG